VYAAVEAIAAEDVASLTQICRFLEVNRTAFHAWRISEPTVFEEQNAQLAPLVRIIFKKHRFFREFSGY